MVKKRKRYKTDRVARSAKSGRFLTKKYARRHPSTTVIETIRRPKGK